MWKNYRKSGLTEMTPWKDGMDLKGVSISEEDIKNGSPKNGDMIARNPKNPDDKWLVNGKFFKENYEEA